MPILGKVSTLMTGHGTGSRWQRRCLRLVCLDDFESYGKPQGIRRIDPKSLRDEISWLLYTD